MASVYKRPNSPFFWVKFRDREGKIQRESTSLRIDNSIDVRSARTLAIRKTLEEREGNDVRDREEGWVWVPEFLKVRYHSNAGTLERYLDCWQTLWLYLQERKITSPAALRREHCYEYIGWRAKPNKRIGKYKACRNTAILELKVLRVAMHEAVERKIVFGNPCVKLGLKKERPKEKPELTADDCEAIRNGAKLVTNSYAREMLTNSFEIAIHQGCRLTETRLDPVADVDLTNLSIRFRNAKGGRDFVTRLHPGLVPLIEGLRKAGKRTTWDSPPNNQARQWASATWWKFLDNLGLKAKGITFHGSRVTVVTELARANVAESKAQAFVGHASTTVHRIYQRLRPSDLSDCTNVVAAGKPPSSSSSDSPSET